MKNIIKKILREEIEDDGFDWIREIEPNSNITLPQLYYQYGFGEHNKDFINQLLSKEYKDLEFINGKLFLVITDYCELHELFVDDSSGGDGYINQYITKNVLCEIADFWEPYDNTVYNWMDQVWGDCVLGDEDVLFLVKEHVRKKYLNQELEDGSVFSEEQLNDNDILGDLINSDELFRDLKDDMRFSYNSSYNNAVTSNMYTTIMDSISGIFGGKGEWVDSGGDYKVHIDVTDVAHELFSNVFGSCYEWCEEQWYRYEEGEPSDDYDMFFEYCDDCDREMRDYFLGQYIDYLKENGDLLNPRFDEYVTSGEIRGYYQEDLENRLSW